MRKLMFKYQLYDGVGAIPGKLRARTRRRSFVCTLMLYGASTCTKMALDCMWKAWKNASKVTADTIEGLGT